MITKPEIRNPKSEIQPASGRQRCFGIRASDFFRHSSFGLRISTFLALLVISNAARACSVCFGNSDSKLSQGMLAGVLVLLLFVLAVLGGFVALFVYLARRAAATAALENEPTEKA